MSIYQGQQRRVLLVGRAGIGKSTLCQKIAHDWASGRLWNGLFEVVYWMRLRELNDLKIEDPHTFLFNQAIPLSFKNIPTITTLCNQIGTKKTLLILDGYDEANPELRQAVEVFLQKTPLHILLTSRPGKIDTLDMDQTVENIGFSDKQIGKYIDNFSKRHSENFTQEAAGQSFFKAIKNHPSLYPLAHVPLQLQMIASVYEKRGSLNQASSLTGLYQVMIELLYDWHFRGEKTEERNLTFNILGKIALIGLFHNKSIIAHEAIQHLDLDSLLNMGIFKKTAKEKNEYEFIHQTFQDFFAALYISQQSAEEQNRFVLDHRGKLHYQQPLAFITNSLSLF